VYGARAEKPLQNADFAMKQTNICRLSGDIIIGLWTCGRRENCEHNWNIGYGACVCVLNNCSLAAAAAAEMCRVHQKHLSELHQLLTAKAQMTSSLLRHLTHRLVVTVATSFSTDVTSSCDVTLRQSYSLTNHVALCLTVSFLVRRCRVNDAVLRFVPCRLSLNHCVLCLLACT